MTMIALMPSDSTRRSPALVRADAEDSALQPAVGIRRLLVTGRIRNTVAIAACALLVPLFDLGGRAITLFVTRCFAATGSVAIAAGVAISLSLLAAALWMYVRHLRVSIEHLTKAIELHSASDEHAPLPERGPGAFDLWGEHIGAGTTADDNLAHAVALTRVVVAANDSAESGRVVPLGAELLAG